MDASLSVPGDGKRSARNFASMDSAENKLLDHIKEDFFDLHRQMRYVQYLADEGRQEYSEYVRLWVQAEEAGKDASSFISLHESRASLLNSNGKFWDWDNFIALRHAARFRAQLEEKLGAAEYETVQRVDRATVDEFEIKFGCKLPIGFREYICEVADVLPVHPNDVTHVSFADITQTLTSRRDLRFPCEWQDLSHIDKKLKAICKNEAPNGELERLDGVAKLSTYPYMGDTDWLVLKGDVAGIVLWHAYSADCDYCYVTLESWRAYDNGQFAEFEDSLFTMDLSETVAQMPLDTFTWMQIRSLNSF